MCVTLTFGICIKSRKFFTFHFMALSFCSLSGTVLYFCLSKSGPDIISSPLRESYNEFSFQVCSKKRVALFCFDFYEIEGNQVKVKEKVSLILFEYSIIDFFECFTFCFDTKNTNDNCGNNSGSKRNAKNANSS